jgi:hypothetical protein
MQDYMYKGGVAAGILESDSSGESAEGEVEGDVSRSLPGAPCIQVTMHNV